MKQELEYTDGKHAIHCPTKELTEKVAEIVKNAGGDFTHKQIMEGFSRFSGKISNFCVLVKGVSGGAGCFSKSYYANYGCTIIPADEFIRANTEAPRNLEGVQVGDRGWTSQCGDGVFWDIDDSGTGHYPLVFKGDNGETECYTMTGLRHLSDRLPSAYFAQPVFDFPLRPVPVWVPEKGDAVWVRDYENGEWEPSMFRKHSPGSKHQYGVFYGTETVYWRFCAPSNGGTPPAP